MFNWNLLSSNDLKLITIIRDFLYIPDALECNKWAIELYELWCQNRDQSYYADCQMIGWKLNSGVVWMWMKNALIRCEKAKAPIILRMIQ